MPANTFWLQNCLAGDNSLRCIDMRYYIASPKPALQYLDVSNCLLPHLLPHITGSEQGNIYFLLLFLICLVCQTLSLSDIFPSSFSSSLWMCWSSLGWCFLLALEFWFHLLECCHSWQTHILGVAHKETASIFSLSVLISVSVYLLTKWKQNTYFASKMLYETLMTTISDWN